MEERNNSRALLPAAAEGKIVPTGGETAERNGVPLLTTRKAEVVVTPEIVNELRDDTPMVSVD